MSDVDLSLRYVRHRGVWHLSHTWPRAVLGQWRVKVECGFEICGPDEIAIKGDFDCPDCVEAIVTEGESVKGRIPLKVIEGGTTAPKVSPIAEAKGLR